MPRPKRRRMMANPPAIEGFRPFGVPIGDVEPIELLFEEYESLKLSDYEGLTQEQAAQRMNISRPTFTRIYEKARKSIATAFVEGKAIIITGGDFHSEDRWYRCRDCNQLTISKEVTKRCSYCSSEKLQSLTGCCKEVDGEVGKCLCTECDIEIPHQKGEPCREHLCPGCGMKMVRKGCYHHQLYLKSQGRE